MFHEQANKLNIRQEVMSRLRQVQETFSADIDKFNKPSQLTPPKTDHEKKNFQKDKRDHNKQDPTEKWCDYHNSTWHDTSEFKSRKTFLAKLLTFDLFERTLVEFDQDATTPLDSTSTNPIALPSLMRRNDRTYSIHGYGFRKTHYI